MNAIYTNQSTRENMDLLYAQARVYDRVKNWNRLNFLIQPEPGICRFRVVVFAVGVIWTPGAYL